MTTVPRGEKQEAINMIFNQLEKAIYRGMYGKTTKLDLHFDIQEWFQSSSPAGLLK